MTSPSENGIGAEEDIPDENSSSENGFVNVSPDGFPEDEARPSGGRVAELLQEEREEGMITPQRLGNGTNRFREVLNNDDISEDGSLGAPPRRVDSPIDSVLSNPDDTPSIQGSILSSPAGSSILPSVASRPGLDSPTPSFRPFDRRFSSRLSISSLNVPRASSPSSLRPHSRQLSMNSQFLNDTGDTDTPSPPWEVVRWTKLKKLNGQAFSEIGKRNFGTPTCISVSASIVLGTSKGIILIFDYHQNLKSIIGPGTKDHLVVAGGHANGSIFTWETAKSARPFLHIPSLEPSQLANRSADGHAPNVAIRHLGFLGTRHTALVSADDRGMAFSHLATRGMGAVGRTVRTTRILGRYPNDIGTAGKPRKPSTVLAFAPLPLGNVERGTDTLGLTAILTPYLLVIVSTTPIAQTQHKASRPKEVAAHSAMSGCLAWFPAVKLKVPDPHDGSQSSKVKLVYCWSNILTVLDVEETPAEDKDKPPSLSFKPRNRWKAEEAIAYKSRMFLLGFNDVSIGTLSNWADRLIALMEEGDYIGAIQLATSYYTGDGDKLTIGLPEDTALRHSMVRDKLVEIMTASLKFAFGQRQKYTAATSDHLKQLAEACFEASLSIDDVNFLFDVAFEWYEDGDSEGIFLETLEPYILEQRITSVPPTVVKAMVSHFVVKGFQSRLEEMICHMDTATLDIDEVTTLCKQHNLYDAFIYVWNQALHDYLTPIIELLKLLIPLVQNGDYFSVGNVMADPNFSVHAQKMFYYMSHIFTGRVYPTGEELEDHEAMNAKAELYWFLLSGKTIAWPRGSAKPFLTKSNNETEPSFPYLRMILKFDAPSFLSTLNEAFEDSFLNDTPDRAINGGSSRDMSEEHVFGLSVNRQYIITILLEVMNPNEFAAEDTIYLDMFIARNLPKFPQYLLLSGTALHKVLAGLCNYPGEDLADDAQLSVEYLLSVYHPTDMSSLIPLFQQAGFYRVLKSIYKADKQYSKLVETYFDDHEDREFIFDCIADCLRARAGLTKRQVREVHDVINQHASELVDVDAEKAAHTVQEYAPNLHKIILDSLPEMSRIQYVYLHSIMEPAASSGEAGTHSSPTEFTEQYVQLMCKYDAGHVASYVETVQASDLRLDKVLPHMEESGVIDAAVVLMVREGQMRAGMDRLIQHLRKLESALLGLLSASAEDMESTQTGEAVEDLLTALQKYVNVGIWLCQQQSIPQSGNAVATNNKKKESSKTELLPEELLWLDLIDIAVQITRKVSPGLDDSEISKSDSVDHEKLATQLRTLVQRTFTALITSTSTPTPSGTNLSFLRILRAFLTKASISSPNLSDLRAVLASVFSAYAYEESILSLANRLLEKDLFVNVQSAATLRQRGWRSRGSTCEACGRRVWGPGVSGDVFSKWEEKQELEEQRRRNKRAVLEGTAGRGKERAPARNERIEGGRNGKGKGKGADETTAEDNHNEVREQQENDGVVGVGRQHELEPLVVLACRHIYHQSCLEAIQTDDNASTGIHDGREFRCPIDA
ncbi:hypothetical protein CJF30_00005546 [Rutstroemia sp. NJR-2017a BBW]|nr:hypothetical protein CJF30_00005838 [Rutstroemia sp. NJR-2017a BBW]PQE08666.1 hypothetical protein CJF30_00005546 [Rutstroemia sp. NJR-2017a BBW]